MYKTYEISVNEMFEFFFYHGVAISNQLTIFALPKKWALLIKTKYLNLKIQFKHANNTATCKKR